MRSAPYSWRRVAPWLALLILAAWALTRTLPVTPVVFARDDRPVLLGVDPLFHARHARYSAEHFPHLLRRDPASHYPSIEYADAAGLYNVSIAAAAIVLSGGRPTPAFVEYVAAWSPVVISVAGLAGVLLLTTWLAGMRAALLAGSLALVYPGAVGDRSLLGFADQHVAEFTLLVWMAVAAVGAARRARAGSHPWPLAARALGYGLPPALLLHSWLGAPLYVAIFGLAAAGAFVVALTDADETLAWSAGLTTFFAGFAAWQILVRAAWPELPVEFLPGTSIRVLLATVIAPLAILTARVASRRLPARGTLRKVVAVTTGLALAGGLAWFVTGTAQGASYWAWATSERGGDVVEQRAAGLFDLWSLYGPVYLLAFLGAARGWMSAQRVPTVLVALLAAGLTSVWLSAHDFEYAGPLFALILAGVGLDAALAGLERSMSRFGVRSPARRAAAVILAACAIGGPFLVPDSGLRPPWPGPTDVRDATAMNGAWYEAMTWLRENSPVPTLSPSADPPDRDSLGYAPGTYGVMTPWDAGNFVALVAERLPVTSRYPSPTDALWLGEVDEAASLARLCPDCGAHEGTVFAVVDAERSGPGLITKLGLIGRKAGAVPFAAEPPGSGILYRFDPVLTASMGYRLYFEDGRGLGHYRLVFESGTAWYSALAFDRTDRALEFMSRPVPAGEPVTWSAGVVPEPVVNRGNLVLYDHVVAPAVKVYRVVRGARVAGHAPPGAVVSARVALQARSTGRSLAWDRHTVADESGRFELHLPYPTSADSARTDVFATGPYAMDIRYRDRIRRLNVVVSEREVTEGATIELPNPMPGIRIGR